MTDVPVRRRAWLRWGGTAIVLVAALGFCAVAKGRGWKTRLIRTVYPTYGAIDRPTVTASRPADRESNVAPDAFVAADVSLPNFGHVIDAASVNPDAVRLYRTIDRRPVPAHVNTSGGGDAIVLKPVELLEPNTQYTFEVNGGLRDTGGTPFRYYAAHFTTAAGEGVADYPVAFEQVTLPAAQDLFITCVTVGPDRKLYASTMDGRVLRFGILGDGTLAPPESIATIQAANQGPRLLTGICFDPASTADNLILWASHGQFTVPLGPKPEKADDWTGKVSRLSGPGLAEYRDVVVHLPRGTLDHLNNQISFGPDGALYVPQASNTAMGAPDHKWGWRPERLLTAALLRLDLSELPESAWPLDVKTEEGGEYSPFAPGAPLTVYASGIRNGYDLVWHSNGSLYVPINGSAAGGNAPGTPGDPAGCRRRIDAPGFARYDGPAVPGLENVTETLEDFLFRVEPGGYYGHPNPQRSEYVLDGGNPTPGRDPGEVPQYPVGTPPDRNWRGAAFSFGKNLSPTGVIEYRSGAPFGGLLRGKLLVTRYSGGDDIVALAPGPRGGIEESIAGIDGLTRLRDPLDLTEDPVTGNLYVAEFGSKCITLLRPAPDHRSGRVYRQAGTSQAEGRAGWRVAP